MGAGEQAVGARAGGASEGPTVGALRKGAGVLGLAIVLGAAVPAIVEPDGGLGVAVCGRKLCTDARQPLSDPARTSETTSMNAAVPARLRNTGERAGLPRWWLAVPSTRSKLLPWHNCNGVCQVLRLPSRYALTPGGTIAGEPCEVQTDGAAPPGQPALQNAPRIGGWGARLVGRVREPHG
jgi:hypothetical protein